jgi:hypothetical protein
MSYPPAMETRRWIFAMALALATGPAIAGASGCGLPDITSSRELQRFLSLRAVEVVRQAEDPKALGALVAPSASFDLGAGDVGRPLGNGVEGARRFARTMAADTYRFLGWDYMDGPADACSRRDVELEFIASRASQVARVTFTFEAGRVVKVTGWMRSFETGAVAVAVAKPSA